MGATPVITHIIEVTNGPKNWGKFLVGTFTKEDWERESTVDVGRRLLSAIGHLRSDVTVLVVDLQTCEGAIFKCGGLARADLEKHKVWVCPLFEPFLSWLYRQDVGDITALPSHVDLPDAPFAMHGYRRVGE